MLTLQKAAGWLVFSTLTLAGAVDQDAKSLLDHGHFKRARAVAEKRLSANAKDAEALVLMARIKLAYGDADAATSLAQQAIAADGKNSAAHAALGEAVGTKARDAGFMDKISMAKQVRHEFEMAVEFDSKNLDGLEGLMSYYLEAPGIAGGSKSKALEIADKIMQLNPERGYYAKAEIAQNDKHADQLEGFYLKAAESNPASYEALMRLAGIYASEKVKNYDKAMFYAQKAEQIDPGSSGAYSVLAQIYVTQEKWPSLDAVLAQAEKEVSDNLQPFYAAGRSLIATGKDFPRAEQYFRKYLTQQEVEGNAPPLAAAHWRLGQILEKENKKDEAAREIETALKIRTGLQKQVVEEAQKDLKRLQGSASSSGHNQ